MKRFAVASVLLLLLCAMVYGDVIYTSDGRKLTGRIVREDEETVTIKTRFGGEITVDRQDIDRIEKGKLPEEIYEEKAKALDKADAQGHYELGLWCKKNGLKRQAKMEFQKTIAANPEHEAARKALGYLKREGKWISAAEQGREKKSRSRASSLSSTALSKLLKIIPDAVKSGELSENAKKALEPAGNLSKKDFAKIAEAIAQWKPYEAQNQEDFVIQSARRQVCIHLPSGYDSKKAYPVIIALHGAGGTGQSLRGAWANSRTQWGAKVRSGYIVAAPTWGDARWWYWPQSQEIYTLIDDLKKKYNVDTNRIMLTGFSNGGHSSWSVGMKQPSLFNGLAPCAGGAVRESGQGTEMEMIASLMNLPVHWVYSARDRICPSAMAKAVIKRYADIGYKNMIYKEFDSNRHVPHTEYWGTILDWFEKIERNMYPKKLVYMSDHAELDRAYWVKLEGVTKRAKITGEITGNTIKLKIEKATKVTVFLSDKMLDMDKPVKVEINGKQKFSGMVKRSAAVALKEALQRYDRSAVYAGKIELDVP